MKEVTIGEILTSREERAKKQINLIKKFCRPVVCFTMNIAGPVKTSPLIIRAFKEGIRILRENIDSTIILEEDITISHTGCEALFSVDMSADSIKNICTGIEEASALGRLFDMDVIDTDGHKLERTSLRGCLVCHAPGRDCAAGRLHTVEEIQSVTRKIMQDYFLKKDSEHFSYLAEKCLLDEVYTTPKPGLVDMENSGSHTDMDIRSFEKSAKALTPYFAKCFEKGVETAHMPPEKTLKLLRADGIEAEKRMYEVTGGVNTHKGAIYSMGLLLSSVGRLWNFENPSVSVDAVCKECSRMVLPSLKEELQKAVSSTAGGKAYKNLGISGIRGEAASGFSSVIDIALPCYKNLLEKGYDSNYAGVITLLNLICSVEDTNVYHRGGMSGAQMAKNEARKLLDASPEPDINKVRELDELFIKSNLSPGGCADLLAVTYFLHSLLEE